MVAVVLQVVVAQMEVTPELDLADCMLVVFGFLEPKHRLELMDKGAPVVEAEGLVEAKAVDVDLYVHVLMVVAPAAVVAAVADQVGLVEQEAVEGDLPMQFI